MSYIKLGGIFNIYEMLMEAITYYPSPVECGLCGIILLSVNNLLNKVNHPFLEVRNCGKAHHSAQQGHQVMIIFMEVIAKELLQTLVVLPHLSLSQY